MPEFPAIHHLALSVTDLEVSEPWYSKLIGSEPAMTLSDGPFHRRVFALPSGQLLGLTRHDSVYTGDAFAPDRPGMDHVGFGVADRAEIERAYNMVSDLGMVAERYLRDGVGGLADIKVEVGNPVRMAQAARLSSGGIVATCFSLLDYGGLRSVLLRTKEDDIPPALAAPGYRVPALRSVPYRAVRVQKPVL